MNFLKLGSSVKDLAQKLKDKPQTGRKYLQNTYLVKDLYSKYTKNYQN